MAIFRLRPVTPLAQGWEQYVPLTRVLVRAADEDEARRIAAEAAPVRARMPIEDFLPAEAGRPNPWLDPHLAVCDRLDPDGPAEWLCSEIEGLAEPVLAR